jgi:hypothetical protein
MLILPRIGRSFSDDLAKQRSKSGYLRPENPLQKGIFPEIAGAVG